MDFQLLAESSYDLSYDCSNSEIKPRNNLKPCKFLSIGVGNQKKIHHIHNLTEKLPKSNKAGLNFQLSNSEDSTGRGKAKTHLDFQLLAEPNDLNNHSCEKSQNF